MEQTFILKVQNDKVTGTARFTDHGVSECDALDVQYLIQMLMDYASHLES